MVEDEIQVRCLVSLSLVSAGYRVLEAPDAAAALRSLEGGARPTAAVVDVGLPDARGHELVGDLRRLAPGLPVVLISGYPRATLNLPPDLDVLFLPKPFGVEELLQSLSILHALCAGEPGSSSDQD